MNITKADFDSIEKALMLLPQGEEFNALPQEKQDIIVNAHVVMVGLYKKRQTNNKRVAEYIANKRKNDKNYARPKEGMK